MITDYPVVSETIEALDRWQVSTPSRPGLIGWTTERRVMAGTVVDYTVDWMNGKTEVIWAADCKIISTIPIPPMPGFAEAAFVARVPLPSNVLPFPWRCPLTIPAVGERA